MRVTADSSIRQHRGVRLFVAVVPPPSALTALAEVVAVVRDAYPQATWVPPERMHVTLAFLGEVADPARVVKGLPALGEHPAFELRVRGGGAFPRAARPNVLWAGLDGDLEALARLARHSRRVAREAGIEVERAPYRPHLTVARVRRRDFDGRSAVAALDAVSGEPWTVTEAVLLRSHLGPHPSYEPLARAPLRR